MHEKVITPPKRENDNKTSSRALEMAYNKETKYFICRCCEDINMELTFESFEQLQKHYQENKMSHPYSLERYQSIILNESTMYAPNLLSSA
jgi:hypothetical protein